MKKFTIILVVIIVAAGIFFLMKYGILDKKEIEKKSKALLKKTEELTGIKDIEKKMDKTIKKAKEEVDNVKDLVEE